MRNMMADKKGYALTVLVIVIVLFVADIAYLVLAVANATFLDAFETYISGNLYLEGLEGTLRYTGPTTIVIINIGLLFLLVVSAWKRQRVETEDIPL